MIRLTGQLRYRKLKKRRFWHRQMYQILAPIKYLAKSGKSIEIKTGFILDFASTPWWLHFRILRWLHLWYPPIGWYTIGVAFHDQGYRHHDDESRVWWDDVMVEIMEILAIEKDDYITRRKQKTIDRFYWAVTKFGGRAWNRKPK